MVDRAVSSSFARPNPEEPTWTVRLERKGSEHSPVSQLEPLLREHCPQVDAIGHRIVHGGKAFTRTARIDADVKAGIARMAAYAPEHNHLEMEGIEICERVLGPSTPQYAVFDTAFHSSLSEPAYVYPGPYGWLQEGIRRYGFHGISHQYVSRRAAELMARPLRTLCMVTCHLGNGCSLAAVRDGQCVDTTMGFTPLEGLMMGTRSGTIDPGIIIHLVRHRGYSAEDLDHVLNKESGLKGVSGISSDMREIEAAVEQGNRRARLAFDIFVRRLASGIAAMVPALGRLDVLVFTGGVGENSAPVREAALRMLEFLGEFRVLVVPTREEWEIAREVAARLDLVPSPAGRG
jgi:acetate kinase